MGRAPCCEKVGLKRGRWTAEEDQILTNYIHAKGEGSWRSLPKNAGLLRCGKSCRLRWINYLRSDLKRGNISVEEEELIVKLHASMGNRWSLIAGHLPGRTDNEIKNYWNSHLCRKLHSFKIMPESESFPSPAAVDLAKAGAVVTKRKGARTSRYSNPKKSRRSGSNNNPSPLEQSKESGLADVTVPMPHTPALEKETLSGIICQQEEENTGKNLTMDPCAKGETTAANSMHPSAVILEGSELASNHKQHQEPSRKCGLDDGCTSEFTCCESAKAGIDLLAVSDEVGLDHSGILVCLESSMITGDHGNIKTLENFASNLDREGSPGTTMVMESDHISASASSYDSETGKLEMEISNVGNGEWSSYSYHREKLDDWDDWKWDDNVTALLGDKADKLSWLWDTDNSSGGDGDFVDGATAGVEMDNDKQNAMVAWLLS